MVTQVYKRIPRSPRTAATCCRPIDGLLDAEMFRALSDPTRLRLLACLMKCARPCSVTEVAECCSVDFSVVSRHLQALARVDMLETKRSGRVVTYAVRFQSISGKLRSLADEIDACCPVSDARATGCCRAAVEPPRKYQLRRRTQ